MKIETIFVQLNLTEMLQPGQWDRSTNQMGLLAEAQRLPVTASYLAFY